MKLPWVNNRTAFSDVRTAQLEGEDDMYTQSLAAPKAQEAESSESGEEISGQARWVRSLSTETPGSQNASANNPDSLIVPPAQEISNEAHVVAPIVSDQPPALSMHDQFSADPFSALDGEDLYESALPHAEPSLEAPTTDAGSDGDATSSSWNGDALSTYIAEHAASPLSAPVGAWRPGAAPAQSETPRSQSAEELPQTALADADPAAEPVHEAESELSPDTAPAPAGAEALFAQEASASEPGDGDAVSLSEAQSDSGSAASLESAHDTGDGGFASEPPAWVSDMMNHVASMPGWIETPDAVEDWAGTPSGAAEVDPSTGLSPEHPAHVELASLRERIGFYESFDSLINDNISRSSELFKSLFEERERDRNERERNRAEFEATVILNTERQIADERARVNDVMTGLMDEASSIQRQVDDLLQRIAAAITGGSARKPEIGG